MPESHERAQPPARIDPAAAGGVMIPPELRGVGLRVVERDGVRSVAFTDDVFRAFNVVSPTNEVAAMDPLWRPSFAVVTLNVDQHGYKGEKQGETALAKNGILALADAAGIDFRTERMPRAVLRDSELGWYAYAYIRQAGGTQRLQPGSQTLDLDEERERITDEAWRAEQRYAQRDGRQPDRAKATENARTRWIKERPYMDAKCETKAILRAARGALQLRHAMPTAQFGKPWLIVRIGLAPDYSDPLVRQHVLDAGLGATRSIYGSPATADPVALEAPRDDGMMESFHPPEHVYDAEVVDGDPYVAPEAPPPLAADPSTDDGGIDPEDAYAAEAATTAPSADDHDPTQWRAVLDGAGATRIPFGKDWKGQTIADVFAADAGYLEWIAGGKFTAKGDAQQRVKAHARDYLAAAAALGLAGGSKGA